VSCSQALLFSTYEFIIFATAEPENAESISDITMDQAYVAGAAFLQSIGFRSNADIARILDIAMASPLLVVLRLSCNYLQTSTFQLTGV
jgi:hypothetical protein